MHDPNIVHICFCVVLCDTMLQRCTFVDIVAPRYYSLRYYVDSDITRSVVDPDFLPPGENAKCACLNLLRIALTILKKQVNNVNDNEQCQ